MKNHADFFRPFVGAAALLIVSFAFHPAHAEPTPQLVGRPLALVYRGPGACREDKCAEAAGAVAERAGYEVQFIGPKEHDASLFAEAAVYLQPGGNSSEVARAMTKRMKNLIRDFVKAGGGYVGFCAGGFYAMTPYDDEGQNRLGLIEGDADGADFEYPSMLSVSWTDGVRHHVFWEGGPYFELPRKSTTEIISRYTQTRQIAAVRAKNGKGRVFVTAFHPEAPYDWRFHPDLTDKDGTDADLDMAVEMVKWAARPSPKR